ncbi:Dual specificity protein phosphatase 19 [Amphibalanus amphitrite]|uniref:Dual specificity protein phosphatase 19 n=1 Tax=Amphibalanus amphitrite TaxID=1232801 RepID=A0A6A4VUY9_AMPAM|nr:Dual specificity protein phosphatase 19 [Amphibalanus amphitrite]
MDLQARLELQRRRLVPTESRVTSADGRVTLETRQSDGRVQLRPAGTAAGFVVDPSPDLQVGEVRGWLCVGSQDAAHHRALLRRLGVTHVLNCATRVDNLFTDELTYLSVPLLDLPETRLETAFPAAFEFIDSARATGGRCLVHCNAGVSRSASLCVAYLMEREGLTFTQGLQQVNAVRRVRPNPGFQSQLIDLGRRLRQQREGGP